MANTRVKLYRTKKDESGHWSFVKTDTRRLRRLTEGAYYTFWYEGKKRRSENVGREPDVAVAALHRRQKTLEAIAAGVAVVEPDTKGTKVAEAVADFLAECRDRVGKSGYGMAKKSIKAYQYRLGFMTDFAGQTDLSDVDLVCLKRFRKFLREHPDNLGDRTCYNIVATVGTFLRPHDNSAAAHLLAEMSFPPKPVTSYSDAELNAFFAACTDDERLTFKFFLHSMARESEVAHTEVGDFLLDRGVLHIQPKPDRGFRLKGKRSGQAVKGRKVPIPTALMTALRKHCAGKHARDLVFPNSEGRPEGHFLRKCQAIANRAGLKGADWGLHRFRKTGATRHHEGGVSVRKIQSWLGHESLDVTLAYLGVEDAADEASQEQVNNGALSAFA